MTAWHRRNYTNPHAKTVSQSGQPGQWVPTLAEAKMVAKPEAGPGEGVDSGWWGDVLHHAGPDLAAKIPNIEWGHGTASSDLYHGGKSPQEAAEWYRTQSDLGRRQYRG